MSTKVYFILFIAALLIVTALVLAAPVLTLDNTIDVLVNTMG